MKILSLSILLIVCLTASGQSGLKIYTGLSKASNKDKLITPSGLSHKGNILGLDAHLNSGNMYFVLGGQMARINFLASNDSKFLSVDNKMTWLKLRVGLGYNIVNFSETMAITAKTLGSINVISTYPNQLTAAPYQNYNASTAGVIAGLGFTAYNIYLDLEYEKGFFNAVNMVEGTQYDFLNFTLGFKI